MTVSRKSLYIAVMSLSFAVITIDTFIILHHFQIEHRQQALMQQQTSELGSQNVPLSTEPSPAAVTHYYVAPNLPRYLIIPAIHVDARVYSLSTNPQDQIQAPANIYDTGWYTGSSLPGKPGAMFIDGHVSSWTAHGVFYNLKNLKSGDTIQVVRGDNKILTYVVKKLQVYDAAHIDMSQVLSPIQASLPGLNLMTCTGSVMPGTSEFSQRLVVYGVLKS